uniref:Uncharacterized protein n=1 Tax=viral metagenome TaxID=1070528 RepID=A0A6M3JL02_9ZZZZ
MEQGKYTRYSQSTLPKRKRTVRVPGSFEDKNKYLRCWNCGFVVNTERDLGSSDRDGNYQEDFAVVGQSVTGSGDSIVLGMDTLDMVGIILKNGADGDPITEYYTPRVAKVSHGCALCGVTSF